MIKFNINAYNYYQNHSFDSKKLESLSAKIKKGAQLPLIFLQLHFIHFLLFYAIN